MRMNKKCVGRWSCGRGFIGKGFKFNENKQHCPTCIWSSPYRVKNS